jgi:tetratricopeptide (TPR) repeat protein
MSAADSTVRLDAVVHVTATLAVVARASAQARANDLPALSDALVAELLRGEWSDMAGTGPAPGAITSRSLPALRAFLDGELHLAAGRFRTAAQAYDLAIRSDSTFWFAYWRYMYVLGYHGVRVDSAIVTAVLAHHSEFPEPDGLLIEAWLEDNVRRRVEQLRAITTRFPAYWAAWFALGDALTHHGSFLGHPLEESLAALQQATALYPNFVPAWEHYFWRAVYARDTTRTRVILDRLRTFPLDSANADRPDLETLTYYR